jgi:hypothetical protein
MFAKQQKKELIVIWTKTAACPGMFLDFFQPIDGISFETKMYSKIDYCGYNELPEFPADYTDLKLTSSMQSMINEKINILQHNYIAVHIRRTDCIYLAKSHNNYTSDEQFIEFIDRECKNTFLYIATDNKETYNHFTNKYNKLVKFKYHDNVNNGSIFSLRKTSLQDAIIDLYMCNYSSKFMGSGLSSFSDLINKIRKTDANVN